MIETALRVSERKIASGTIEEILLLGKSLLDMPIELLPGVEETLGQLSGKYKLVLATKGDLLDQQRKLKRSGLIGYFEHIGSHAVHIPFEVMWQHEVVETFTHPRLTTLKSLKDLRALL